MKGHHLREEDEVGPSESAKRASLFREEEQEREEDEDCGDIAEHLGLGFEIGERRKQDVAATLADVVHQLEKWKLMPPLPEKVGQGDGCREGDSRSRTSDDAGIDEAA